MRQAWIPPFASVPIEVAAVITRGVYSGEPEQSDTSFAQLLIVHDPVHAAQGLPTSSSSVLDIMSTAQRCNRMAKRREKMTARRVWVVVVGGATLSFRKQRIRLDRRDAGNLVDGGRPIRREPHAPLASDLCFSLS